MKSLKGIGARNGEEKKETHSDTKRHIRTFNRASAREEENEIRERERRQ